MGIETAHWLTLAAMTGGLVAFLGGLMQYRRAQRWKRAEFVANEMKEFKADPMVHNALLLSANLRDFERVPGLRVENWLD